MSVMRKSHETAESVDRLVAALEITGLDKRTTLVLGGGALAFAGIRPAEDLDIMVTGENYEEMKQTGKTPGGLLVHPKPEAKQRPFLAVYPAANKPFIMPTDITFPHNENFLRDPLLDEKLIENIASFNNVAGYHYLPPQIVAEHKLDMQRPRSKDRRDIRQIGRFLARQPHA